MVTFRAGVLAVILLALSSCATAERKDVSALDMMTAEELEMIPEEMREMAIGTREVQLTLRLADRLA